MKKLVMQASRHESGGPYARSAFGKVGAVLLGAVLTIMPAACGGNSLHADPLAQDENSAPLEGFGKYLAGRQAQTAADSAAAAAYYQDALERDPSNVTLARRAYFFLLAEGRYEEALRTAEQALKLDPEATVAPLVLAAGAVADQQFAEGLEYLHTLEPKGLNAFMLPMLKAWTLTGMDKTDEAIAALAPMQEQPQLIQLHDFHAGLILDLAGRDEAAWESYKKTIESDTPLSLRTVEVVASWLVRHDRKQEAEDLIQRYRKDHPGSMLVDAVFRKGPSGELPIADAREGMAEALYGAASSVLQSNALDTGLAFARLAMLLRPDFPYAKMLVGDILQSQDRSSEAIAVYRDVSEQSPVHFPVRLRMAEALEQTERADEAIEVLRQIAKNYSDAFEPLVQIGDLMRRQENWNEAANAYGEAIERAEAAGNDEWTLHYSLGVALERSGTWTEAEKQFLKALDLSPDQPLVLNYLGYSWIDQGINLDEGKKLIEKAVEKRPNDGYIVDSLGWAYYLLGEYDRAVVELERAVELSPADPTINDHLGDAYWRVGRVNEAKFQWRRALTLDPEPTDVDAIAGKIKQGLPQAKLAGTKKK